ncbi:type VI secretion system-associated lipoprotein [Roseateles aquatilis]|uniref:Type VI secretion system-associated lipoprotein n=1 Tax=Roseateles aquatilis TaxID=431061 RepID=A0A246IWK7_9BURK|nr:type VI secretion system lipoprotein TssJ [Roseateles aquatilis]OWQ84437.1 type VI secretion system-associated lipoprotein [Roseateles aquatilis]
MPTPRSGFIRSSRRAAAAVLGAAALLALGACSSVSSLNPFSSSPKPTVVNGSVTASAQVNPSVTRRPSPLLVRVYELKSANAFNSADFISLYQKDQAELGAEMVAREEMTLQPGESRPLRRTLAPETRFIAVFAAYRDLENARWRTVVPVNVGKKQEIVIQADELSVSATVKQP